MEASGAVKIIKNKRFPIDPDQRCDRWKAFLEESIGQPEMIRQVQEFFGYCMTNSTAYGKSLLLVGPGQNGKSVLTKVLGAVVGIENICFLDAPASRFGSLERRILHEKALCVVYGSDFSKEFLAYFKAIVTGDSINACDGEGNFFVFRPRCKVVIETNQWPRPMDAGMAARLLPIVFTRQFSDFGSGRKADPFLYQKLYFDELPGIMAWSLEGLDRLISQGGFTECRASKGLLMAAAACQG